MAKIRVHGGDFPPGEGSYFGGILQLKTTSASFLGEAIPEKEIKLIEVATENNVKKFWGAAGMGLAGGFLLGPVGALAGLLIGGRKKEVTFIAQFRDGRKLLATTNNQTYTKLLSASLSAGKPNKDNILADKPIDDCKTCPMCAEEIKFAAIKCRFCGYLFSNDEIQSQLQIREQNRLKKLAKDREGKKRCPGCKQWDVYYALIEDGSFGDWCPHCRKSLLRMQGGQYSPAVSRKINFSRPSWEGIPWRLLFFLFLGLILLTVFLIFLYR